MCQSFPLWLLARSLELCPSLARTMSEISVRWIDSCVRWCWFWACTRKFWPYLFRIIPKSRTSDGLRPLPQWTQSNSKSPSNYHFAKTRNSCHKQPAAPPAQAQRPHTLTRLEIRPQQILRTDTVSMANSRALVHSNYTAEFYSHHSCTRKHIVIVPQLSAFRWSLGLPVVEFWL